MTFSLLRSRRLTLPESAWWAAAFLLFASARLFESGLSLDPAMYATLARGFARTGDWWNMRVGTYLFPQFYEHPFLVFWIQGAIFKFVGATDFTARLLGVISGSMTGFYLFRLVARLGDESLARVTCSLTLLSIPFMGRIATLYLEIPLMWFAMASLYHAHTTIATGMRREAVLAGIYLGLCFLTKGIASFPVMGTIGFYALYVHRRSVMKQPAVWITLPLGLGIFAVFCMLQAQFGSYSFVRLYLATGLFGKAIHSGASWKLPVKFFGGFFRLHPVHCVLAVLSPLVFWRGRGQYRDALVFAVIGLLMFGIANGSLDRSHQHYFYPLFPFANILAAAGLIALFARPIGSEVWLKVFLVLGLIYHVAWNWIPANHRRKPASDFFELAPRMAALKAAGVREIYAEGLTDPQWGYPAMSLWYWDLDTRAKDPGEVILIERGKNSGLTPPSSTHGHCYSGSHFTLWVRGEGLLEKCRNTALAPKQIR